MTFFHRIPGCGGHYTASKGDISSPLNIADGKYKHNLMCDYVIRMPINTRVRLEFKKFELEESASCKFDKLEIFEGTWNDADEGLIGRYCGTQMPPVITSQSNVVSIKFTTDWSASEEGFQLTYKLSELFVNHYERIKIFKAIYYCPISRASILNLMKISLNINF